MQTCDECQKGKMMKKPVDYILLGVNLGKFNAFICQHCEETVFSGDTFVKIEKMAKEKGIWGIGAKTRIGTSGNALDVKLPKSLVGFMHLKKGQEIFIEPVDQKKFQVVLT